LNALNRVIAFITLGCFVLVSSVSPAYGLATGANSGNSETQDEVLEFIYEEYLKSADGVDKAGNGETKAPLLEWTLQKVAQLRAGSKKDPSKHRTERPRAIEDYENRLKALETDSKDKRVIADPRDPDNLEGLSGRAGGTYSSSFAYPVSTDSEAELYEKVSRLLDWLDETPISPAQPYFQSITGLSKTLGLSEEAVWAFLQNPQTVSALEVLGEARAFFTGSPSFQLTFPTTRRDGLSGALYETVSTANKDEKPTRQWLILEDQDHALVEGAIPTFSPNTQAADVVNSDSLINLDLNDPNDATDTIVQNLPILLQTGIVARGVPVGFLLGQASHTVPVHGETGVIPASGAQIGGDNLQVFLAIEAGQSSLSGIVGATQSDLTPTQVGAAIARLQGQGLVEEVSGRPEGVSPENAQDSKVIFVVTQRGGEVLKAFQVQERVLETLGQAQDVDNRVSISTTAATGVTQPQGFFTEPSVNSAGGVSDVGMISQSGVTTTGGNEAIGLTDLEAAALISVFEAVQASSEPVSHRQISEVTPELTQVQVVSALSRLVQAGAITIDNSSYIAAEGGARVLDALLVVPGTPVFDVPSQDVNTTVSSEAGAVNGEAQTVSERVDYILTRAEHTLLDISIAVSTLTSKTDRTIASNSLIVLSEIIQTLVTLNTANEQQKARANAIIRNAVAILSDPILNAPALDSATIEAIGGEQAFKDLLTAQRVRASDEVSQGVSRTASSKTEVDVLGSPLSSEHLDSIIGAAEHEIVNIGISASVSISGIARGAVPDGVTVLPLVIQTLATLSVVNEQQRLRTEAIIQNATAILSDLIQNASSINSFTTELISDTLTVLVESGRVQQANNLIDQLTVFRSKEREAQSVSPVNKSAQNALIQIAVNTENKQVRSLVVRAIVNDDQSTAQLITSLTVPNASLDSKKNIVRVLLYLLAALERSGTPQQAEALFAQTADPLAEILQNTQIARELKEDAALVIQNVPITEPNTLLAALPLAFAQASEVRRVTLLRLLEADLTQPGSFTPTVGFVIREGIQDIALTEEEQMRAQGVVDELILRIPGLESSDDAVGSVSLIGEILDYLAQSAESKKVQMLSALERAASLAHWSYFKKKIAQMVANRLMGKEAFAQGAEVFTLYSQEIIGRTPENKQLFSEIKKYVLDDLILPLSKETKDIKQVFKSYEGKELLLILSLDQIRALGLTKYELGKKYTNLGPETFMILQATANVSDDVRAGLEYYLGKETVSVSSEHLKFMLGLINLAPIVSFEEQIRRIKSEQISVLVSGQHV
jgi:hypothetical protein